VKPHGLGEMYGYLKMGGRGGVFYCWAGDEWDGLSVARRGSPDPAEVATVARRGSPDPAEVATVGLLFFFWAEVLDGTAGET
jgi:hypothetical protein